MNGRGETGLPFMKNKNTKKEGVKTREERRMSRGGRRDAVIVGIHKPSWVHWIWTSTVIFKLPHSLSLLNRTKMFKK